LTAGGAGAHLGEVGYAQARVDARRKRAKGRRGVHPRATTRLVRKVPLPPPQRPRVHGRSARVPLRVHPPAGDSAVVTGPRKSKLRDSQEAGRLNCTNTLDASQKHWPGADPSARRPGASRNISAWASARRKSLMAPGEGEGSGARTPSVARHLRGSHVAAARQRLGDSLRTKKVNRGSGGARADGGGRRGVRAAGGGMDSHAHAQRRAAGRAA